MHLSTNRKYQQAKSAGGFEVVEFDSLSEFKSIVVFDHAPAEFKDGIRKGDNVMTADCLIMEVDNIEQDVSIDDFFGIFKGIKFFLNTSRSHQKEKITGGKPSPACDRYHVLFPLVRAITKAEYEIMAKDMIKKYSFFDSACVDASRFFFGNQDTEVFSNPGKELEIPELISEIKPIPVDFEYEYTSYNDNDKRQVIFSALQIAASRGGFDDYASWIKIGMALKADGWSINDWISVSKPGQNIHELNYKWNTFPENGKITGATLLYYARLGDPNCLVKGQVGVSVIQKSISFQTRESEVFSPGTEVFLPKMSKPTKLDHAPSDVIVKKVSSEIYYQEEDGKQKLKSDWFYAVPVYDAELANCIHYDYTIGTLLMEYHNTAMLNNAIIQRLRYYVPMVAIKESIIERLKDFILSKNCNRNRVAESIDYVKSRHLHENEKSYGWELEEFIDLMDFTAPIDSPYTDADLKMYYREVWHLFFLRMHMHIDGTRINIGEGNFKGLLENDIIPVLQGAQGIGKTTLSKYIAMHHFGPDLYVDLGSGSKSQFGSQETAKQCRGKLLAEIGEMKLMRKSEDVETVKSFVSKLTYEIDVKYVEFTRPLPVTVSFIGTSNNLEYLTDTTGNRRWWPIWLKSINKEKITKNPELIEKLHAHYARLVENSPINKRFDMLIPSDGLMKFMNVARERSMVRYSDYEAIIEVVNKDYIEYSNKEDHRCKYHKMAGHNIEKLLITNGYTMKVSRNAMNEAMEKMGYEKAHVSIGNTTVRGWKREIFKVDY